MASGNGVFGRNETHGIIWRRDTRVHASSEALGWSSMFVSAQYEAPFEQRVSAVPHHLLVLHVGGPARVHRLASEENAERTIPPGGVVIHPGGAGFGIRLDAPLETVHVYLRKAFVDQVAAELEPARAAVDLLPRVGVVDPLLEQLVLALRAAMSSQQPGSAPYADHLGRALAAHLVRAHSTAARSQEPVRAWRGLTNLQMDRALACIEASLDRHVSPDDVAAAAGLSTLHFQRCFKLSTGLPLHRYVLRARVELAKRLLADTRMTIVDVASACGFTHQEHLTRVFRTWSGATPAAFRRAARL